MSLVWLLPLAFLASRGSVNESRAELRAKKNMAEIKNLLESDQRPCKSAQEAKGHFLIAPKR